MLRYLLLFLLVATPVTAQSQSPATEPAAPAMIAEAPPVLTLDQAITRALEHNRVIKNEQLEVEKAEARIEIARTRRLPQFAVDLLLLQPLTPLDFRFDRGSLGQLPGGGPFPLQDTKIQSARAPHLFATVRATQPLSQLPRIKLGVRLEEVNRELAANKLDAERQQIVSQTKRSYYAVLQTESALKTLAESLKLHRELDRVVGEYVAQKIVLTADSLDIKTRLAQDEYEAIKLRHSLSAQKEQLNLLLGRDLRHDFATSAMPAQAFYEFDLAAAHEQALRRRPEIKEARLKMKQADYGRRIKRAEEWPEVSLTVGSFAPLGVAVLPRNVIAAGVAVKWEPFDWGRKKRELVMVRKTIEQADNALREAEAQVLLEVNIRFRKLEEARAWLAVTQAAQQAAREKLRVATNKFQHEAVLFKDVLQSQTAVTDANHQQQQALVAFLTARADFDKAIGEQ